MNILSVPKVLLLVCDAGAQAILQQTLAPHAELTWVSNPQEMSRQLGQAGYDVVVCARDLCVGNWKDVLEEVRRLNVNLPVIILSPNAQEEEWEEVLAAGAFDLLGLPYYEQEPLDVVEHAVASYEARVLHDHARAEISRAN